MNKLKFPDWILNTDVEIYLETEGEAGPDVMLLFSGKANHTESQKQILTAQKELITLSGVLICKGDLNPNKPIDGYVVINGIKKQIVSSARYKNPDGSVFSTELSLG